VSQTQKARVFFVDDEEDLAASLADKYSNDYETMALTSPHEALSRIDESVAVVVADHRMPGMTGVELLAKLRVKSPETVRILLTAFADLIPLPDLINEAKVFHYIPKTPLFPEHMKGVLADAVELYTLRQQSKRNLSSLKQQNVQLKAQLRVRTGGERSFEDLLGNDPRLQEAIRLGKRAATHDRPVLITGESGTGKDVLARAIHFASRRKAKPFKATNCAFLRPELAQATLFGKVKGAFTGAETDDKGILRQADGGTVFLNEVGQMSPEVQAFLLSFLDYGQIEPLGYSGTEHLRADVRIIAATNEDIVSQAHAGEGRFRLDLYNRLNGTPIRLPPLRERPADIPMLARHAVIAASSVRGLDSVPISDEATAYLQSLPYPGNVRELINIVEQAVDSMQDEGLTTVEVEHVRAASEKHARVPTEPGSLEAAVESVKKQVVEAALKRHGYKQAPAAAELGITDRYLRELVTKFGISKGK
jgi:two-component system, NtrC family, response regulator HupR/HoxA